MYVVENPSPVASKVCPLPSENHGNI